MSTADLHEEGGAPFTLPAVMDLPAAALLKSQLQEALAGGKDLTIDAGAVQRVTTPCLQVLVAATKLREMGGPSVQLNNVPEVLAETARTLGLSQALRIEEN